MIYNAKIVNRLGQFYTVDVDPVDSIKAASRGKLLPRLCSKIGESLEDFLVRTGSTISGNSIQIKV